MKGSIKNKKLIDGYTLHLVVNTSGNEGLCITYPKSKKVFAFKIKFTSGNARNFFNHINSISDISGFDVVHGAIELRKDEE